MLGLINAYKNYKENKETKFSTYAYFYIMGEVKKYIKESKLIKVSKELLDINKRIEKTKILLSQKYQREISDEELSKYLDLDINLIKEAKESNLILKSLDYSDEDTSLYDFIGYSDNNYNIDYILLNDEINKLSPLDKKIILERYKKGLTQQEVSNDLGLSQVKVSRKEKEILTRLRTKMT